MSVGPGELTLRSADDARASVYKIISSLAVLVWFASPKAKDLFGFIASVLPVHLPLP